MDYQILLERLDRNPDARERARAIARTVNQLYMHNVAVGFELQQKLSHVWLAWHMSGKHHKSEFAASVNIDFRGSERMPGRFTARIPRHTRCILTGCKAPDVALLYSHLTARKTIEATGMPLCLTNFSTYNTMCTFYMNHNIDLDALHDHLPGATYNPSKIKHLSYKMLDPVAVHFLVHATGRVVVVGSDNNRETRRAMDLFTPLLSHFVVGDRHPTDTPNDLFQHAPVLDSVLFSQRAQEQWRTEDKRTWMKPKPRIINNHKQLLQHHARQKEKKRRKQKAKRKHSSDEDTEEDEESYYSEQEEDSVSEESQAEVVPSPIDAKKDQDLSKFLFPVSVVQHGKKKPRTAE